MKVQENAFYSNGQPNFYLKAIRRDVNQFCFAICNYDTAALSLERHTDLNDEETKSKVNFLMNHKTDPDIPSRGRVRQSCVWSTS